MARKSSYSSSTAPAERNKHSKGQGVSNRSGRSYPNDRRRIADGKELAPKSLRKIGRLAKSHSAEAIERATTPRRAA